jgi:hypothetical protein
MASIMMRSGTPALSGNLVKMRLNTPRRLKPVVDRLVRAIILGRIAPHRAVLYELDYSRHDSPAIYSWHSMPQREKWLDPAHLRLAHREWNIHRDTLSVPPLNQPSLLHASNLTGPEPRNEFYHENQ